MRSLAVAVALAALPWTVMAGTPASGELASKGDEVTWSGGPFYVPNPTTTVGVVKQVPCDVGQPSCDTFRLTVNANGIKQVAIAIAPAAGFETDDYDLHVYDDQGNRIASDAGEDGYESVVIDVGGSAWYDVRVQPWLIGAGSSYNGVAQATRGEPADVVRECFEAVPENVAIPALDSGQVIDLSIMLLLDGTDPLVAQQLMAEAAASYRPLNINLRLAKMSTVTYTSTLSEELIAAAKQTVGGKPPKGIDIVGVFTNKKMQSATGGVGTVVGQADCIGGIRWDDTSFLVFSDIRATENPGSTFGTIGLNPNIDAASEVIAHEIGHLMGAHHHYSNCVEGNLTSGGPGDVSPCTLMFPAVNFASLNFSALEGATVRGHAVNHAAP